MNKFGVGVIAVVAIFLPGTAHADTVASGGFGIALSIPVVCDLNASEFVVDESQNSVSGFVREFCNSSRGFQVLASHRPLDDGEIVEVNYGNDFARLETNGISAVAFRSGPRLDNVPVQIRSAGLGSQLAVSFSITAI